MCWPPRSAERRRQGGFTLVELMVGIVIGLLASLAVTQVLVTSEGQKRTTASGSEAMVNGALALGAVQRSLMSAGYGFAASAGVIGCPLTARYNNAAVPGLPAALAPVVITQGSGSTPADAIRILSSGKESYAIPLRVVSPYAAGATSFEVGSGLGVAEGDFMVAATAATQPCEMFRVTAAPSGTGVPRADAPGAWNPVGYPGAYGTGSQLLNLGPEPMDVTYTISGNALRVDTLRISGAGAPSYERNVELFPDVVDLQALYGKDTTGNGTVDTWDTATPTTNAGWRQVIAVRLALVVRSAQREAGEVTTAAPQWDVGTAYTIAGTAACGTSQCLPMAVDHLPDWKHYRYRVFDTLVPLRNMLWAS